MAEPGKFLEEQAKRSKVERKPDSKTLREQLTAEVLAGCTRADCPKRVQIAAADVMAELRTLRIECVGCKTHANFEVIPADL